MKTVAMEFIVGTPTRPALPPEYARIEWGSPRPRGRIEWPQINGMTPSQSLARDRVWLQGFGPSATCLPSRVFWGLGKEEE